MKAEQIMSRPVITARPHESLRDAARHMWDHDCGSLPVVDDSQRVIGMITDRDICMAAFTRGEPLHQMSVQSAMAKKVYSCRPNDGLDSVGTVMGKRQIRRLPVVDESGELQGIVALSDVVREANSGRKKKSELKDALSAMASICRPRERALQAAE